ncbi:MAG: hypothetical protein A4E23_01513 [Methanomethylovorans sp. PtaU1.Bin073]|nr:MAG: hypothetical protein A4E23_01513 [Methanomethylovorans sp. PtaU1.Bin073]
MIPPKTGVFEVRGEEIECSADATNKGKLGIPGSSNFGPGVENPERNGSVAASFTEVVELPPFVPSSGNAISKSGSCFFLAV